MVYKLTNGVCTEKWSGPFAAAVAAQRVWHARESLSYSMQWGQVGVESLNLAERQVARSMKFSLVDTRTQEHCECSGRGDGRHFLALVPDFLHRLMRKYTTL